MSRKTEVLCDRCGKEMTSYDIKISSAKIHFWGLGENRTGYGQRIDLCEDCYIAFLNFLDGGESD